MGDCATFVQTKFCPVCAEKGLENKVKKWQGTKDLVFHACEKVSTNLCTLQFDIHPS